MKLGEIYQDVPGPIERGESDVDTFTIVLCLVGLAGVFFLFGVLAERYLI